MITDANYHHYYAQSFKDDFANDETTKDIFIKAVNQGSAYPAYQAKKLLQQLDT